MSNIQHQIHRLENILKRGYTMRPTVTGGTYIQQRDKMPSIIHRTKEKVALTKGRRRMYEAQLRKLQAQRGKFLWQSKFADTTLTEHGKTSKLSGQVLQGTYERRIHGELKN